MVGWGVGVPPIFLTASPQGAFLGPSPGGVLSPCGATVPLGGGDIPGGGTGTGPGNAMGVGGAGAGLA